MKGKEENGIRLFHDDEKTIPVSLKVGDKVMIVSHQKIVGVTTIKKVVGRRVKLTKSHPELGAIIPVVVKANGHIFSRRIWEMFYYDKKVCERLGLSYIDF